MKRNGSYATASVEPSRPSSHLSSATRKDPVFIQIRLKRDQNTGRMHVTDSAQEKLENFTNKVIVSTFKQIKEQQLQSQR